MEYLKSYVYKNKKQKSLILITSIVFVVIGVVLLALKKSFIIGGILIVLGVLSFYGGLTSDKTDDKNMESLKKSGKLDDVINDFKNAESYLDDDLRLGHKYIFRKANSKIIAFDDVDKIEYKETNDAESMTLLYYLTVRLKDGSWQKLYSEREDHLDKAQEIMEVIKSN